jgi:hypothetical protein
LLLLLLLLLYGRVVEPLPLDTAPASAEEDGNQS